MQLDIPARHAGQVTITVYDVTGRRVRTLVAGSLAAGRRDVAWDVRDSGGRRVGAGIYFARMEMDATRVTHRIVVLH